MDILGAIAAVGVVVWGVVVLEELVRANRMLGALVQEVQTIRESVHSATAKDVDALSLLQAAQAAIWEETERNDWRKRGVTV